MYSTFHADVVVVQHVKGPDEKTKEIPDMV
jgi:hypothetical protein